MVFKKSFGAEKKYAAFCDSQILPPRITGREYLKAQMPQKYDTQAWSATSLKLSVVFFPKLVDTVYLSCTSAQVKQPWTGILQGGAKYAPRGPKSCAATFCNLEQKNHRGRCEKLKRTRAGPSFLPHTHTHNNFQAISGPPNARGAK